jgi:hypothetical protein
LFNIFQIFQGRVYFYQYFPIIYDIFPNIPNKFLSMARLGEWGWMSGVIRCKYDKMAGADDGFANPLGG